MQPLETAVAARQSAPLAKHGAAIRVNGKFFFAGETKFFVQGVTYGPFGPGSHGAQFPEQDIVRRDFDMMATMGANTLRVFTPPPLWLLDLAAEAGLKVLAGIPWSQHVTFLDDPAIQSQIITAVSDLDKWVQERSQIAARSAGWTREGTAVSWR